jgi:hypothetical protein
LQCDETGSFYYEKKERAELRNIEGAGDQAIGDVSTWETIDADTKLFPGRMVGDRTGGAARIFVDDLASRLASCVLLTTDCHKEYLQAVEDAYWVGIDYAVLVRLHGPAVGAGNDSRYSPTRCTGSITGTVMGDSDRKHVWTSYVERQSLST